MATCEKHNCEGIISYTQSRGHATELAKQGVVENFDSVIAMGGDGTVNEVAQGLLHTNVSMGIIPKGSGNGLARHLGIPMFVTNSLNAFFNSQQVAIDTFLLNGKLSLNVSGIGFDGHIANLFGGEKKRGLQGYAKLTLKEFFRFQEFEAEISDGVETVNRKAFVIAVANSSQYGNNARIAPIASVCDQLLHINVLRKVPAYRFDFMYAFFRGMVHRSSYCEIMETRELKIRTNQEIPFHIDGEPCGSANSFEIKLLPASLMMQIPNTSIKF